MQNVTRTVYKYNIVAYDMVDDKEGMRIEVVADCQVVSPSMSKAIARKCLAEATRTKPKKGLTIKWDRIGTVTYAMPADEFFKNAVIVEQTDINEQ